LTAADAQPDRAALARVDALHTALTELVLVGGDLTRIADEVARALEVQVLITTNDGRELAVGGLAEGAREDLAAAGLTDPTGRFRVERAGRDGVPLGERGQVRALRVVAGGTDLGRLVCLRTSGPVAEEDLDALARAATVTALLLTREQAVAAVESKYRGDFLRDVFLGRAGDPAYVVEHAQGFGWELDRPGVVLCAEIDPPEEGDGVDRERRREWQDRFSRAWRQVAAELGEGIATADFSSEVVAVLPVEGEDPAGRTLVAQAVAAVAGDRGGGRRPFSVGVSRTVPTLRGLPEGYAQARRAVEVGRTVHGPHSTTHFDDLGLHRLLALVPDQSELRAFAEDVLGPLAGTSEEARDLRTTLQVLLDTNFNVAVAARAQFFHYNTMRYRVGKLERLLGPLSGDPHLRLDVAVALRALEITGVPGGSATAATAPGGGRA
jgi:purine catabolism regulator